MDDHDNYYETAATCFKEAIKSLGGDDVIAMNQNLTMYNLAYGLLRLTQGLLQENRELESRLADLARRLPPPR